MGNEYAQRRRPGRDAAKQTKAAQQPSGPQTITVLPESGPDGMPMGDPLTLIQSEPEKEKKQHWWNKLSRKKDKNQIQDVYEGEENPYAPTDPQEIARQKAAA